MFHVPGGVSFKTLSSKYSIKLLQLNGESKGAFDFINGQGENFMAFNTTLNIAKEV